MFPASPSALQASQASEVSAKPVQTTAKHVPQVQTSASPAYRTLTSLTPPKSACRIVDLDYSLTI